MKPRARQLALSLVAITAGLALLAAACGSPGDASNFATVQTVAGTGERGDADGPVASAMFARPEGVAVALDGTLWVTETLRGKIRRVSPDGKVETIEPSEDLNSPHRLAVDPDGSVYVTDAGNHRVVRLFPDGRVEAIAGTGDSGLVDGPGSSAQFNFPIGIARAPDGTIYVADSGNSAIRKIDTDGVVTTLAGGGERGYRDGSSADAQFNGLNEVALDAAGNIYATDSGNSRLRKVAPDGTVITVAGYSGHGFKNGKGSGARFDGISGITVGADGNIYVTEFVNHRIRQITPGGTVTTLAGGGEAGLVDGAARSARFRQPTGITVGPGGVLYVADSGNHAIRTITLFEESGDAP